VTVNTRSRRAEDDWTYHRPLASARPLSFFADFHERHFAWLVVFGTFLQEAQRSHTAREAAANDDKIIVRTRSHVVNELE
jgi:hypothetical protein